MLHRNALYVVITLTLSSGLSYAMDAAGHAAARIAEQARQAQMQREAAERQRRAEEAQRQRAQALAIAHATVDAKYHGKKC